MTWGTLVVLVGFGTAHGGSNDRAARLADDAFEAQRVGRYGRAERLARRSLALEEHPDALFALGHLYLRKLQQGEALLASLPAGQDAEARTSLTQTLRVLADRAQATFRRAFELDPDSVRAGVALDALEQRAGEEILAPELVSCPDAALDHWQRAEAAMALHDVDAAYLAYREALAGCPGNGLLWTYAGDADLALGRPREALAAYERAVHLTPCLPIAHRFAADTLLRFGSARAEDDTALWHHALSAVACNPRYDAGWGTLDAVATRSGRKVVGRNLAHGDPAAVATLVLSARVGEGSVLERRVQAARRRLADAAAPTSPLWSLLAAAEARGLLDVAVAFETLDREVEADYRRLRAERPEALRAYVEALHLRARD